MPYLPIIEAVHIFYALSTALVFCSVMVVSRKNPVASAIYLVGTLFLVAAMFAFMGADFVAAIQVLVYAGAIMVLFLFVIMLLNIDNNLLKSIRIPFSELAILMITCVMFICVGFNLFTEGPAPTVDVLSLEKISILGGNTKVVGMVLFMKYVWPFELASILILLAIVASVVIAKKDKGVSREEQA